MKAFVHVNLQRVYQNHKHGLNQPVIGVVTYQGAAYGQEVEIDAGRFIQDFAHPKACGAKVFIDVADASQVRILA